MPIPAIKISPSHETQRSVATVRHKNTRTYNDPDFGGGANTTPLGLGHSPSSNDDSEYFEDMGCIDVLEEDESHDEDDDDDDIDDNVDKEIFKSVGTVDSTSSSTEQNSQQKNDDNNNSVSKRQLHGKDKQLTEFERTELIPALAIRSCHVPGNNVITDYIQHICNVHPIFGICCHNKLHPIGTKMRLWNLFSSIMLGLTLTNCMWLWFFSHGMITDVNDSFVPIDPSKTVLNFQDNTNWTNPISRWTNNNDGNNDTMTNNTTLSNDTIVSTGSYLESSTNRYSNVIQIHQGMIVLWTVGCLVHSIYDILIWYLEVCSCCPRKHPSTTVYHRTKYQQCGTVLVILMTFLCAITATLTILLRASIIASNEAIIDSYFGKNSTSSSSTSASLSSSNTTDPLIIDGVEDSTYSSSMELLSKEANTYEFVLSYFVELILALFVFAPIIDTIIFSGVLGCCGLIPCLGGRPYEVKQALNRRNKHRQEQQQQQQEKDSTTTSQALTESDNV